MTRVALFFGGQSPEHEVSIVSARFVHARLREIGCDVSPIGIDIHGGWHIGQSAFETCVKSLGESTGRSHARAEILGRLSEGEFEVVFPLIHGLSGEDGSIQGMCELLSIPFVGGDCLNQSICFDKLTTRCLLSQMGFPQPRYISVTREQYLGGRFWSIDRVEKELGFPAFVKPSRTGSSIGVSKAHNRGQLDAGLQLALQYDTRAVVETAVIGREVEVALLGDKTPLVSAPGEIIPENDFYDFEEKYIKKTTSFEVPASLRSDQLQTLSDQAIRAWQATNCFGLARVDFLIDDNQVVINEINTVPGFTEISMYLRLLRESGRRDNDVMQQLIDLALKRGSGDRKRVFLSHSNWFQL